MRLENGLGGPNRLGVAEYDREGTMGRLADKSVVITGAANGIGRAAATRFAAEGARLLLVDRDAAALQDLAGQLGPAAASLTLDVTEDDSAARYTEEARRRYGRIDAALLNAGIEGEIAPIEQYPLATFDRLMAVNVRAVWLGLASLLPAMKAAGGGSIVITSSVAGLRGTASLIPYTASKHAVIGLMRAAAREGAPDGVRVNTVNPGPIETRMIASIDAARGGNASREAGIARIPLGRYGKPEEVAALMLFLASDEASFCTGNTYVVDGGMTA